MGNVIDLTGQRFNRWTVLKEAGRNKSGGAVWLCRCDCGIERVVDGRSLRSGTSKSCGCYAVEVHTGAPSPNKSHGGWSERLYKVWQGIIQRCYNPNNKQYCYYGAKGITVCDEWRHDYAAFREWALSHGYDSSAKKYECTIDRIDNNRGYAPDNCRWVAQKKQCNNRSSNHILTVDGVSHTISEWVDITGLPKHLILKRINNYGWSPEDALSTPPLHSHTHTA